MRIAICGPRGALTYKVPAVALPVGLNDSRSLRPIRSGSAPAASMPPPPMSGTA